MRSLKDFIRGIIIHPCLQLRLSEGGAWMSNAKALHISIPVIYNTNIVYRVWPYYCITLAVNLVDWSVSCQTTINDIADIRHRWVTNMSDIIERRYVSSYSRTERGWPFVPLGAKPHATIPQLQSYYQMLSYWNVCKRLVILNSSFVSCCYWNGAVKLSCSQIISGKNNTHNHTYIFTQTSHGEIAGEKW